MEVRPCLLCSESCKWPVRLEQRGQRREESGLGEVMRPDPPGPRGLLLQGNAVRLSRGVSFPDLHFHRITLVSVLGTHRQGWGHKPCEEAVAAV